MHFLIKKNVEIWKSRQTLKKQKPKSEYGAINTVLMRGKFLKRKKANL